MGRKTSAAATPSAGCGWFRTIPAFGAIRVVDVELLHRSVELYEVHRLDFAVAYLVACAERTGIGIIASFGRSIDRKSSARGEQRQDLWPAMVRPRCDGMDGPHIGTLMESHHGPIAAHGA